MFWNRGEIPFKDGNPGRPNKIHGNDVILITVGSYSNTSDEYIDLSQNFVCYLSWIFM